MLCGSCIQHKKKQFKVQIICILEEINSFYWPKMHLRKGDKNLDRALPPPWFRQNPKEQQLFFATPSLNKPSLLSLFIPILCRPFHLCAQNQRDVSYCPSYTQPSLEMFPAWHQQSGGYSVLLNSPCFSFPDILQCKYLEFCISHYPTKLIFSPMCCTG